MTCGTDVWENNGEQLFQSHSFRDLIFTRDDIFLTLRRHGITSQTAQAVMECVRKGKFYEDTDQNHKLAQQLLRTGVPAWYIESMRKIRYLFPKAHAAHYAKIAATLAWFKVYYPKAFYSVSLAIMKAGELLQCSDAELREKRKSLDSGNTRKEQNLEAIELLLEARHRNVFLDSLSGKRHHKKNCATSLNKDF